MRIVWPEIGGLSFPDEEILEWSIDLDRRCLQLTMFGGWLGVDEAAQRIDRRIVLTIGPWRSASEAWHPERPPGSPCPSERLAELCECGFGPDSAWLAGFAGTPIGGWVRYDFEGPATAEW